MNYELAKALKDAGYPQKSAGDRINPKGYLEYSGCWDDSNEDDYITLPTLSELIEACGEELEYLKKHINAWEAKGLKTFEDPIPDKHFRTLGETPSEAVAHLWLALNKK